MPLTEKTTGTVGGSQPKRSKIAVPTTRQGSADRPGHPVSVRPTTQSDHWQVPSKVSSTPEDPGHKRSEKVRCRDAVTLKAPMEAADTNCTILTPNAALRCCKHLLVKLTILSTQGPHTVMAQRSAGDNGSVRVWGGDTAGPQEREIKGQLLPFTTLWTNVSSTCRIQHHQPSWQQHFLCGECRPRRVA